MEQNFTLKPESRVKLPNNEETINLGYTVHVADDPYALGTDRQALAKHRLQLFQEIKTEPDTAERAYYECVHDIAILLGGALSRAKDRYEKDLVIALERKLKRHEQLRDARKSGDGLNAMWILVKPLALFLGGALVAQIVGLFTPLGMFVKTTSEMSTMPWLGIVISIVASIVVGLAFMIAGRTVGFYINFFKQNRIDIEYEAEKSTVDEIYDETTKAHREFARKHANAAWMFYSGQEVKATITYEDVASGVRAMRRRLEQQRQISNLGDMKATLRLLRRFGIRPKRRVDVAKMSEEVGRAAAA